MLEDQENELVKELKAESHPLIEYELGPYSFVVVHPRIAAIAFKTDLLNAAKELNAVEGKKLAEAVNDLSITNTSFGFWKNIKSMGFVEIIAALVICGVLGGVFSVTAKVILFVLIGLKLVLYFLSTFFAGMFDVDEKKKSRIVADFVHEHQKEI